MTEENFEQKTKKAIGWSFARGSVKSFAKSSLTSQFMWLKKAFRVQSAAYYR